MNSNLKLLPAALLVAVLALAGCGGGGSDDMTPTDPTPTPTPEPQPPASVESLSLAIQTAENDAMAANDMAAAALKSAMKYDDMLTTTQVAGDSGAAMMAAQAILKAEMDVGTALADAEDALADAEAAKMDVMALADDHPHKATLMTSVDRVVEMAKMYVAAIKAISTGTDLEAAVILVEGTGGKEGTPRSIANTVGEAIAAALAQSNAAGHPTSVNTPDPTSAVTNDDLIAKMDDSRGMTWEEIVMNGGGDVVRMPIGASNVGVKVASIAGMKAADVWNDATNIPAESARTDGSAHTTGADYMGIPGTVHCLGTDCKITDGVLAGSWYFAPTATGTHWVRNTANATRGTTPYVADSLYVTYGYWLSQSGSDWVVNTFANQGDSTTAGASGINAAELGADEDLGNEASYSGGAVGMSSRTAGSGDSKTTDSGQFTADVTLNAKFGATPTVTGVINNFEGGAVNSAWRANLGQIDLAAAGTAANGTVVTNGLNGAWSAEVYGTSTTAAPARPTGIFGGFSAHFSDGDAVGAYTTTKD